MAKKDEAPEHIAKYQKLSKKARQMITTMEKHHRNAYDAAVDDVLLDENGKMDMELLEDAKNQDKFAEKMADHYISKAKQVFRIGDADLGKLDEMEKELLMNAYAGTTKAQLKHHVRELGKGFTFEHFYGKLKPQFMKQVQENLNATALGHFTADHIEDIVKYTKADFADPKKMQLGDALQLLEEYEGLGTVIEKQHKKALYYKKEKKAA